MDHFNFIDEVSKIVLSFCIETRKHEQPQFPDIIPPPAPEYPHPTEPSPLMQMAERIAAEYNKEIQR
jgi:hypothetical protein